MGIDVDDVKIQIDKSLQCLMKSCHQCAKNHPLVLGVMILFIVLLDFGNMKKFKKDDARSSATSSQNSKHSSIVEADKSDHRFSKGDNEESFGEENLVSEATLKNDLIHGSSIGEMPMKIEEEKNVGDTSFDAVATREVERSEASVPGISQLDGREANSGQAHKFMGDISESDAEFQEDDDEAEPQKEMNKAVQWTEDGQKNLMDLGSSEIERNRRLESLIAKRRARKLLGMQPQRNIMNFNDNEHQVTSIVTARSVDAADSQPGLAPLVSLPARNPFDLPCDPYEEKPVLLQIWRSLQNCSPPLLSTLLFTKLLILQPKYEPHVTIDFMRNKFTIRNPIECRRRPSASIMQ
ncbi:hypothetical protein Ancab_011466 [Ancistrocladus abbreviatus]